jgi:hypothetical protein
MLSYDIAFKIVAASPSKTGKRLRAERRPSLTVMASGVDDLLGSIAPTAVKRASVAIFGLLRSARHNDASTKRSAAPAL